MSKYYSASGMADANAVLNEIAKGVDTGRDLIETATDIYNRYDTTAPADYQQILPGESGGLPNFDYSGTIGVNNKPPEEPTNWTPWLIGGGVVLALVLLAR